MSAEGGMITTNDDQIDQLCRMLRNHGMQRRYYHEMIGFNFRMTDLCAAIGVVQLGRFNDFTEKRMVNAAFYNSNLTSVIIPKVKPEYGHVWHQYTIRVKGDRDAAVAQLNNAGIGTGIFYPVPAHKQGYIIEKLGDFTLPVAEQLAKEVISIPVHPQLVQAELELIVNEVNKL